MTVFKDAYCAMTRAPSENLTIQWLYLVDFLVKNNLINPSQHGFLKARSCLTNILCFLEDVTKLVDEGSPVDIIYLDF